MVGEGWGVRIWPICITHFYGLRRVVSATGYKREDLIMELLLISWLGIFMTCPNILRF